MFSPEQKRKRAEASARWRAANPEKYLASTRNHRQRNRAEILAKQRVTYQATAEAIDRLKFAPCTDCRLIYPAVCMDFDHLDPATKTYDVAQMKSYSLNRVLQEIAKCELVCANCHRIRTADRRK